MLIIFNLNFFFKLLLFCLKNIFNFFIIIDEKIKYIITKLLTKKLKNNIYTFVIIIIFEIICYFILI